VTPHSAAEEAEARSLALVLKNVSEELSDPMREDGGSSGEAAPLIAVYNAVHEVPTRALP